MADPKELMERYCDGDSGAFRELYGAVAPRLLGYLVKLACHRALAADLLQQTFLKVHRARAAYIRGADPVPWIYSIAHRTFIDEARKRTRERGWFEYGREGREPDPDLRGDIGELDGSLDPELASAALAALAGLSPSQREAVVLVKLEGKTFAEAAEIAGTTITVMKVRAHRGYRALRRVLERSQRDVTIVLAGGRR